MALTPEILTAAALPEAQASVRTQLAEQIEAGIIDAEGADRLAEIITTAICRGLAVALTNPAVAQVVDPAGNPIGRIA